MFEIIILILSLQVVLINSVCVKHERMMTSTPSSLNINDTKKENIDMIGKPYSMPPINKCLFVKIYCPCGNMDHNCNCLCNNDPGSITVITTTAPVKASCEDLYGPCDCTYDEFCNCNCSDSSPVMNNNILIKNVQNNVELKLFTNSGYKIIYNYPYGHIGLTSEIISIRNKCSETSKLCFGCYSHNQPSILSTIACGSCLEITKETSLDNPIESNGVYWYFTPQYSFGYSDLPNITQNQADTFDLSDSKKVSWHLDLHTGGWRCGRVNSLNSDNYQFYKIILKLSPDDNSCESKMGSCPCPYDSNCNCYCLTTTTPAFVIDKCEKQYGYCPCDYDEYCNCNCPIVDPIPIDPPFTYPTDIIPIIDPVPIDPIVDPVFNY